MPKDEGSETQAGWVTPAPAPDRSDRGPTRIAGRYTIEGQLGVGGMGTVYRVRDHELDEVVALKMVRPELALRPTLAARFRQEVKLARRVTHPNVVRTFDLGEYVGPDGTTRLFLTMEYVEGRSLTRILAEDGPLSPARATPLVLGICAGLQAAHDAKVLHRDLKPDNVLVDGSGRAMITDFGIARAGADDEAAARTLAGVIGTPAYMAPEQARAGAAVDHRVDLYALGAMLFEVLTGRRAWDGTDPLQIAVSRATEAAPDPRQVRLDIPPAIARVVLRAMAPRPEDRFPSARAVADAWTAALTTAPAAPTPAPHEDIEVPYERAGSLAVLPFTASNPEDRAIAEGLAEELVDTFSMTRGLRVRPLGAHREAAATGDARELGRRLDVAVVVEGTVRRVAERFRVTVRCVSVADGFQLGAWRFESADPMSIADDAAATVAKALTVDLAVPARRGLGPAATELYLKGKRELRANWFNPQEALSLLEQALALAPDDPVVLAEYAAAVARSALFAPEQRVINERARGLAERAVALGPERAEGWFALAVTRNAANDPCGAAAAAKAALIRSPNHVQAQETLASLLLEAGAVEEAMIRCRSVLASDPASTRAVTELVRAHALLGEWDRAARTLGGLEMNPGRAIVWARLRLWNPSFPAPPTFPEPPPDAPRGSRIPFEAVRFLTAVHDGVSTEEQVQKMLTVGVVPDAGRLLSARMQMAAEALSFLGRDAEAIEALRRCVDNELIDIVWFDRCRLVQRLAGQPGFAELRAVVAERAARILVACH